MNLKLLSYVLPTSDICVAMMCQSPRALSWTSCSELKLLFAFLLFAFNSHGFIHCHLSRRALYKFYKSIYLWFYICEYFHWVHSMKDLLLILPSCIFLLLFFFLLLSWQLPLFCILCFFWQWIFTVDMCNKLLNHDIMIENHMCWLIAQKVKRNLVNCCTNFSSHGWFFLTRAKFNLLVCIWSFPLYW